MRNTLNCAGVISIAVIWMAALPVQAAEWNGSYAAEGQCFCVGDQRPGVNNKIVPTPIGGQSVAQVCARIGSGPSLDQNKGVFNYPVFSDAQCGHGPVPSGERAVDETCAGTYSPDEGECEPIGPRWDLKTAFSRPAPAVKSVAPKVAKTEPDNQPLVKKGPRYIQPARASVEKAAAARAQKLVAQQKLAAQQKAAEEQKLAEKRKAAAARKLAEKQKAAAKRKLVEKQKAAEARKLAEKQKAAAARKLAEKQKAAEARKLAEKQKAAEARKLAEKQKAAEARKLAEKQKAAAARKLAEKQKAAEARKLAEKQKAAAERKLAEKQKAAAERKLAEKQKAAEERKLAEKQKNNAVAAVSDGVAPANSDTSGKPGTSILSALRLPPETRASSRVFDYIDAMPVSYEFGGGGLQVEGSAASFGRLQYLARVGLASTYQELMVGAGYYLTPPSADRMTVILTAGIEYGTFALEDNGTAVSYSDNGVFLGLSSRLVANNYFELQAGVGYSSFFEGDPLAFGTAFFHINRQLDVLSRFEIGDNDSVGIGIRYYY